MGKKFKTRPVSITPAVIKPPVAYDPPEFVVKPRYFKDQVDWADYLLTLAMRLGWKLI